MKTTMKFAMKISRRLRVKSTIITPNRSLLTVFLVGGISESRLLITGCRYHLKNMDEEKDSSPKKNWMACLTQFYQCLSLFEFTWTFLNLTGILIEIGWNDFGIKRMRQTVISTFPALDNALRCLNETVKIRYKLSINLRIVFDSFCINIPLGGRIGLRLVIPILCCR